MRDGDRVTARRIALVSNPYCLAAASARRRKLEYTPAYPRVNVSRPTWTGRSCSGRTVSSAATRPPCHSALWRAAIGPLGQVRRRNPSPPGSGDMGLRPRVVPLQYSLDCNGFPNTHECGVRRRGDVDVDPESLAGRPSGHECELLSGVHDWTCERCGDRTVPRVREGFFADRR